MSQILVREIDPQVVAALKQRAARHGRSLQGEVKDILTRIAAPLIDPSAAKRLRALQRRLAGRTLVPSAELIREDRKR